MLSACAYNGLGIIAGQVSLMVIAYTKLRFRCQKQAKFFSVNRREVIQRIYMLLASCKVTLSLMWPDPSQLHRGIIICSASTNIPASGHAAQDYVTPLRKLRSGHTRLGETIVEHQREWLSMFHVKNRMWCGISPNLMEL